jgi:hypothetical protein
MQTRAGGIAWALVLAATATPAIAEATARSTTQSRTSRLFKTPAWQGVPIATHLVRGSSNETLLFTVQSWEHLRGDSRGHGPVYEYAPQVNELHEATRETWDRATGDIVDCSSQSVGAQQLSDFRLDPKAGRLFYKGGLILTKGSVALAFRLSPSQEAVAVLSAKGPKIRSFMPFLGGGASAHGQHYHEVFNLPELTVNDELRVQLPFTTQRGAFVICWSADEQFVVYTSVLYQELCVVRVAD